MYRIYRKIPDSFQGDFEFLFKKWYFLEEFSPILRLISWSLPDDEGGITCMNIIDKFIDVNGLNRYFLIFIMEKNNLKTENYRNKTKQSKDYCH